MEGLRKLEAGRYEYLGFTITREKKLGWRVGALGGRDTSVHLTLRAAWRILGEEEVPTVSLMTRAEIRIPRRHRGTHMDPSQERYWSQ